MRARRDIFVVDLPVPVRDADVAVRVAVDGDGRDAAGRPVDARRRRWCRCSSRRTSRRGASRRRSPRGCVALALPLMARAVRAVPARRRAAVGHAERRVRREDRAHRRDGAGQLRSTVGVARDGVPRALRRPRAARRRERYWRGPVLGLFDGRAWMPLPVARDAAVAGRRSIASSAVDYAVTLEPSNRPWLFALDVTLSTADHAARRCRRTCARTCRSISDAPVHERVLYTARSYTRYRVGADESRVRLQDWLELPPGFNPRTHAFAAQMQADETAQRARRPATRSARRAQPTTGRRGAVDDPHGSRSSTRSSRRRSGATRSTSSCSTRVAATASTTRARSSC